MTSTTTIDAARDCFSQTYARVPQAVASAPTTFPVIGELTDAYGGTAILGLSTFRVAVALSERDEPGVSVTFKGLGTSEDDYSTRFDAILNALSQRHMLPSVVKGADVVVVADEAVPSAFGIAESTDAAFALALMKNCAEVDEAPTRAKLADVCWSAITSMGATVFKSRYTAALRGQDQALSVIDYSDGSVAQVPLPARTQIALVSETTDDTAAEQVEGRRRSFIADACQAFGAESLRLLPDAPTRVLEWLAAVHDVHPDSEAPSLDEGRTWLEYMESETSRAVAAGKALRSRREADVWRLINESSSETATMLACSSAPALQQPANAQRPLGDGSWLLFLDADYSSEGLTHVGIGDTARVH